jgi:hypothetical protein
MAQRTLPQKSTILIFETGSFFKPAGLNKKKFAAVWDQKLYIGEYSGTSSLKFKNSGI